MKARTNINSLFGTKYDVSSTGKISWNPSIDPLDNSVQDYLMRHFNLYKKIKKTDRAMVALSDAKSYMHDKNQRVVDKLKELSDIYIAEYKQGLERGYSQERAKKLATEEVDHQKKRMLGDIDEDFPTEINDKILPTPGVRFLGKVNTK